MDKNGRDILDEFPLNDKKKRVIVPKLSLCGKLSGFFTGKDETILSEFRRGMVGS